MEREIKFRMWCVMQNKMFSAEEMEEDQLTLLTTGKFINVHGGSTSKSTIYPSDKFIPLQFTGLKDKNGKEIYEGDIILNPEATEPEEKGFIVKFIGFKWLGVNVNYPNNHYYSIDFSSIISEKYEVVGNIHQPELIK